MSFALMSKPAAGVSGRSSRSCRSVTVKAAASNRASWFPGTPLPSHLDGTLPGDFGFDPLNLGVEPFKLQWYVQAELQNGRWAMLGVAGILFQELLGDLNVGGPAAEVPWFDQKTFQYYAPPSTLFIVMMFLFSWVEINRSELHSTQASKSPFLNSAFSMAAPQSLHTAVHRLMFHLLAH
ncbi:hypothetical protein CEUSTIGMA_g13634.t1 [Chlamydomonas eustigma]|uniref:Chlorophyll a-b binding protein, chloroplastic n=1 Tax=Chlamydomonas eustigma TaxID=1157962 RepID=A0A250XSZ9_9CHLO|nr:hypothetical protein CEUSTIGMA_g13634.t1 [Chlamydomonas eustigma]|eukprot:GAX86221.1 hypothetical protein CEUSTIGMA_g13634.t1 [Chlamydomonas eustigma]